MALEAFLYIEGIGDSESRKSGHEGEMEILSWSWGMSQMGTMHDARGGGAGKANIQDLSIGKYADAVSPNLANACVAGKQLDHAILTLRKATGDKPLEYMVIKMHDVIITSVQIGGSGGDERIIENISLNFARYTYSYQPQDEKGNKLGGAVTTGWDIQKNEAVA
jgi:type VI secretion system secreted protein Hcp